MKYLIKSIKWSKNDGVETWWKADSCGYTTYICRAGIYTEEDKKKMKNSIGKDRAFIPIIKKIIQKGREQINSLIESRKNRIRDLEESIVVEKRKIEETKEHFKEIHLLESEVEK